MTTDMGYIAEGLRGLAVPVGELHEDPSNARKGHAVDRIAASLKTYGQRKPIVANRGQGNKIEAGNGTYRAAKVLGWSHIAVVWVDDDPATAAGYGIADNRLGDLSEWDTDVLADVVGSLDDMFTGFTVAELDELLPDRKAKGDDPGAQVDKAAELQAKWGVKTGDLWQLGEHRLICGDCTDSQVVARVMGGERAGACVTDPPYGINREGITNDDPEGLRTLFDGCLAAMPIDDGVLIAFQSPRLEWVWLDATRAAGWHPERLLWMYKPNDETFPWRGWLLTSEAIRASSKGKAVWLDVHPYSHDCYSPTTLGQELSNTEGWHASVKPQAVVIDLVKRVGGIVYDPFSGSGTTLIACERLGRRCRAVEIEPGYVAVALERWATMTGQTPVLVEGVA